MRLTIPTTAMAAGPKWEAARAKTMYTTENIIPMIAAGMPTRAMPRRWMGGPSARTASGNARCPRSPSTR
jgi:hypothetical protein